MLVDSVRPIPLMLGDESAEPFKRLETDEQLNVSALPASVEQ